MKVIEKGEPVHVPFDAGHDVIAAGAVEIHPHDGERGPDQPAAQMPSPGVDPVGGKEEAKDGQVLTNLADVGVVAAPPSGLPKEPEKPAENVVKAPVAESTPAPVKVVEPPKPAPAPAKA